MSQWTIAEILKAIEGSLNEGFPDDVVTGISIDSRSIKPGECFVAIKGEHHDGHRFIPEVVERGAIGIVASEEFYGDYAGVWNKKVSLISVKNTQEALGDLGAWRRHTMGIPVVAITGSNGKTTTKEITSAVLGQSFKVLATAGNFNNLIGVPLTLLRLTDSHELAVVELGMNAPGEIKKLTEISRPNVGVITNIGKGHLEGLGTIDGVMKAKGELFDGLGEDGVAIINMDDERVRVLGEIFRGPTLSYGIECRDANVTANNIRSEGVGYSFNLATPDKTIQVRLPLAGRFNILNALAAATVGYHFKVPIQKIRDGLEQIKPFDKRMQIIRLTNAITVLNDTYNANPESMSSAIETLCTLKREGRGIAVLGDMLELGDYSLKAHQEVGKQAAQSNLTHLFVTGDFANVTAQSAVDAGMDPKHVMVGAHEEILDILRESLSPHDWILVKGSRGMAMEKIVEGLISIYGNKRSENRRQKSENRGQKIEVRK
jgi:UDP-N-acetylmuramoyl-tripeptide--D-alanyl-D-alanine ligase